MKAPPRSRSRSMYAGVLLAGVLLAGCGGGSMQTSTTPPPAPAPTPTPTPTPPAPTAACTVSTVTVTHTAATVNPPQIVFLDPAKYPQAVCNDGSPGAYVFRPGSGAASSRWVISLQGGSECADQPTCAARAAGNPQLISTAPYQSAPASALQLTGIQSSSPAVSPDFYDATQVHPLYCSSDDWSGVKAGSGAFSATDDATWNFQGRAILDAILADLTANHSLSSAAEVLFTGDSAGGVGAFVNVNDVAKLLPATTRFVASSDAAFGNIVSNFSATGSPPNYTDPTSTPAEIAKRLPAIALWNGHGDTACAANATTPNAQVGCYSGAQLLAPGGSIALPMFLSEAQKDTNQLATDGIPSAALASGSPTTAEAGYVSYFATQMRSNLASTNATVSIFSPDALLHVEENDNTLFNTPYTFPTATLNLQQAEGAWYRNPCSPQRNIAN